VGDDTKQQMILAAERLFAERGIAGVSLREIGAAAGQRNNSAAQYHFGSKQGLVDAVFEYRMKPIDARRSARLSELDATGRGDDLRALVEAWVEPLAESLGAGGGTSYARFVSHVFSEPGVTLLSPNIDHVTGALRQTIERIDKALTGIPKQVRLDRLDLAGGFIVHSLADRERSLHTPRARAVAAPELLVAEIVDAVVALLSSPVSVETTRALRSVRRTAS
jgi:AcrR family transcriptional regulator